MCTAENMVLPVTAPISCVTIPCQYCMLYVLFLVALLCVLQVTDHICRLQEYVNGMARLQVDEHEYAYLKAITLFSAGEFKVTGVVPDPLILSAHTHTHIHICTKINSVKLVVVFCIYFNPASHTRNFGYVKI
jgi:hypothetical protein